MNNLFSPLPTNLPDELTEVLEESNSIRIERIVSPTAMPVPKASGTIRTRTNGLLC